MIKEALEYINGLMPPTHIVVEGRDYYDKKLVAVIPPTQNKLGISTLTSIVDYFTDNPDELDLSKAIVHIADHSHVDVVSFVIDDWMQRNGYLAAAVEHKSFPYRQYMPIEDFMIALQTYFVQDSTTADILQMVGNITDGTTVKLMDDGITQQVEAKAGIRVENVKLPNPVMLAPYRTFLEVAQPASAFVFRMKKSNGVDGPTAALFEADGGTWKLDCIKRIRDYLRVALPEGTTILA